MPKKRKLFPNAYWTHWLKDNFIYTVGVYTREILTEEEVKSIALGSLMRNYRSLKPIFS